MCTNHISQLGWNVLGLTHDATHTADQAMFTNRHSQAVNSFLHLGIGFIVQQKASNCLPTFTQTGQSCLSASPYSLRQAFDVPYRYWPGIHKPDQDLYLTHRQPQLEAAQARRASV